MPAPHLMPSTSSKISSSAPPTPAGSSRDTGISGAATTRPPPPRASAILQAKGFDVGQRRKPGPRPRRADPPRMGAADPRRRRGRGIGRSGNFHFRARRPDRRNPPPHRPLRRRPHRRRRIPPLGSAANGYSTQMDGRTWIRRRARLPQPEAPAAARLPRNHRRRRPASKPPPATSSPRHASARPSTSAAAAAPPASSSASTACAPRATGAAAISATCWRPSIGPPTSCTPASSASTRSTPSTTAARSTPAPICPTASSTRIFFTSTWKRWRISPARAAPAGPARVPAVAAEIEALRALAVRGIRARGRPQAALSQAGLRAVPARMAAAARPRAAEFEAFRAREGRLLELFAAYCALDEHLHRRHPDLWIWPQWPEPYRDPDSAGNRRFPPQTLAVGHVLPVLAVADRPAVAPRAAARPRPPHGHRPLPRSRARPPTASAPTSGRTASSSSSGCRVGSPPDDFAPKGQDWGFPPPNSERHREDGYRLFAESIRTQLPPRRRPAHGSRHAPLPPLLDSRRLRRQPKAPTCAKPRTISSASWRSKACATAW